MRDDPVRLSGCVVTRIARPLAAAIRHGAERRTADRAVAAVFFFKPLHNQIRRCVE